MSAVDDFLRRVLRSGLLDREHLQTALRTLPKARREDVAAITDHLIAHHRLTRFQAFKISQGITVGLTVGPYQLLVPIGRGGMGTVYLALDTRNREHVALKILPPKAAREEERLLARFRREMDLSQKVQHRHLARTIEAGRYQNIHYIAMEYIPGQTLFRLVMALGRLSVDRVAHLFAEVASALAQAHRQGVVHRDVKPSNIMVTPHDHAKLLDLGLAFTQGEEVDDVEVVGGKGYIVGSIDYMAPEQTRDPTAVDGRADLYALGCCLYFSVTGKPPFPEGTTHTKVKAHRRQSPTLIRELNAAVPEGFANIIDKLLAKDPGQRYQSAEEVAGALTAWSTPPPLPLENSNDAAFQDAVRDLIDTWTVPEAAAKETVEDAVLFRIEPEEMPAPTEFLSRSIFDEVDHVKPHVWLLIIVGVWVGVMVACLLATCVFSAGR